MLTYDFSKRGAQTLYEYLYRCIKDDIAAGRLQAGERLPSKRTMAREHRISLKTVENAYEQLVLEGYVTAQEKRGYFVAQIEAGARAHERSYIEPPAPKEEHYDIDLTANRAAIERFPYATWARIMREVLSDKEAVLLDTVPFAGVYELREQIARYLYENRGMDVSREQIVIGAGTEYLYGRLLQLLGTKCIYAIEDPGYHRFAQLYESYGREWRYVGIDEEGLRPDELRASGANVVHVSPGHHYPTGTVMPAGRRAELLEWARESLGRYIIEDDYDSEFRFSKRPIPSMQSMDANHRVIYFNTFSKTLAPSVRISYMVLPPALMDRYVATMNFYACTVSAFEQYAMAAFMREGYFERHIHRMKKYYRGKRDAFLRVLDESPARGRVRVAEQDAGNHFLLKVDTGLSDTELKWYAAGKGIRLECLSEYCEGEKERYAHYVIVNYSDLDEEKFKRGLTLLLES